MARNSIGEPVPVADDESVYSKWSAVQGKKKEQQTAGLGAGFLPMTTTDNLNPKNKDHKDKDKNKNKNNNNNKNLSDYATKLQKKNPNQKFTVVNSSGKKTVVNKGKK